MTWIHNIVYNEILEWCKDMKMTCMGIDISDNDISCDEDLVENVDNSLLSLIDDNVIFSKVTNVTGDDITVTSIIDDDNTLESVNSNIYDILYENARGFDDLRGVGKSIDQAGEGISYAEIDLDENFYPDAVIVAFDTYCGEGFVATVAKNAYDAAYGMKYVGDISCSVVDDVKEIPGVGFVSKSTDDPVIVASVHNTEYVGVVAGAMIGSILGSKNTYLARQGSACNVIPGSAIFTVTALMNQNPIDLSVPFNYRMRCLE